MMQAGQWVDLARESMMQPRKAARAILAMNMPVATMIEFLVLAAVLADLFLQVSLQFGGPTTDFFMASGMPGPVGMAVLQFVALIAMAISILFVGRAFGGTGRWQGALALVCWLQTILLALQLGQLVLELVLPPAADILGLVSIVALFWLLTHFVAELHGFTHPWLVFLIVVITTVILMFSLSYALVATGILVPGAA